MVVDLTMNVPADSYIGNVVISAVATIKCGEIVWKDTIMYFHRRFGHLNFDTIERLESAPHSGIDLTGHA